MSKYCTGCALCRVGRPRNIIGRKEIWLIVQTKLKLELARSFHFEDEPLINVLLARRSEHGIYYPNIDLVAVTQAYWLNNSHMGDE